jgi:hypothetical protein
MRNEDASIVGFVRRKVSLVDVAMDTEFPGVLAKPVTGAYTNDYHYKSLKVNVDLLKIISFSNIPRNAVDQLRRRQFGIWRKWVAPLRIPGFRFQTRILLVADIKWLTLLLEVVMVL